MQLVLVVMAVQVQPMAIPTPKFVGLFLSVRAGSTGTTVTLTGLVEVGSLKETGLTVGGDVMMISVVLLEGSLFICGDGGDIGCDIGLDDGCDVVINVGFETGNRVGCIDGSSDG